MQEVYWILDVAFDEDNCRIRRDTAPANSAILRHTALNLLRKHPGKMGVKAKQKKAGCGLAPLLCWVGLSKCAARLVL